MARAANGHFLPGESPNPGGRPANTISITHHIRELLAENDDDGTLKARKVADKLYELSIGDNVMALRELLERVDGKVAQPIDVKTEAERMYIERLGRPPTPEERERVISLAQERERRAG